MLYNCALLITDGVIRTLTKLDSNYCRDLFYVSEQTNVEGQRRMDLATCQDLIYRHMGALLCLDI